ncbi:MAG: hypothetical protein M3498_16765 [Deinococcota bacterium]|nr:hypothetical protein [Deinococcota bacterium]
MTVRTKQGTKQGAKQGAKQDARRRSRRAAKAPMSVTTTSRAILFVFGLIGVVGSLHAFVMVGVEAFRYAENSREISRLRGDIAELDHELGGLQAILDHARDARYREQLARRQGFAYPDEQRFFTLTPPGQESGDGGQDSSDSSQN